MPLIFAVAVEFLGQTGAWQFIEYTDPIRFQPRVSALSEWRRRRQSQDMWQKIGDLVQQINPVFRILDAHMHVHAADHEPVGQRLHVLRKNIIAVFISVPLDRPISERMSRRCDNFNPVIFGDLRHGASQS